MWMVWHTTATEMLHNMGDEWWAIFMLVALITILFNAIVYMVSRLFMLPQVQRYAKGELLQALAIVAIGGVLLTFQATGNFALSTQPNAYSVTDLIDEKTAEALLGVKGYAANPYEVDYVYMAAVLKLLEDEFKTANSVSLYEIPLKMRLGVYSASNYVPLSFGGLLEPLWSKLFDGMMLAEDVMWLSISTYFQLNLLQWIEASMAAIYLPLGIIFRAIPLTRGLGAAMLGIAITLYFIYPFVLAVLFLSGPPLEGVSINVEEKAPQTQEGTVEKPAICPNDPTAVLELIDSPAMKPDSPQGSKEGRKFSAAVSSLSQIQLYAFFYPLVAMFTSLMAVTTITSILGGDLSGIGRSIFRVI